MLFKGFVHYATMNKSRMVSHHQLIHPYLRSNLSNNMILELKDIQQEMLEVSQQHQTCFMNSCTGSGKTLAYLLPIMNNILYQKQKKMYSPSHGSVILTLNKQLSLQIYKWVRLLDPQNMISVKRVGPISHYIPVISQLVTDRVTQNNNPKTAEEGDIIDHKINENLVNTVKWSTTDILVSTPQLLYNMISLNKYKEKQAINPEYLVIDEADILLELDKNVSRYTNKLYELFSKNKSLRCLISASSFPKKMNKLPVEEGLKQKFKDIVFIKGENQHKIPQKIELYSIDLDKEEQKDKNFYMRDILLKSSHQKVMIFCNQKSTLENLYDFIKNSLELDCLIYHASLNSTERSRVLHRFQESDSSILLCTDLASRGLDFKRPISLIIEYQMSENITTFLNRVGRTGRNRLPGQVITFIEQKDRVMFDHLSAIVSNSQKLDDLFSRKRSYNKLYKKQ